MKNTNRFISGIIFIFCSILFTSCSHYYYGPNNNNTPLLKEHEAKINLQLAATDEFTGFEFQSAFAVAKHIGIMVNFIGGGGKQDYTFSIDGNTDETDRGSASYFELGGGYFTSFINDNWIFETYAGAGFGGIKNEYDNHESSKVKLSKLFIQPAIGFRIEGIEAGISSRFSQVMHTLTQTSVSELNNAIDFADITYLEQHKSSFLWEPGFVIRAGFKGFLFQLQLTRSVNMTNPKLKQEKGIVGLGVCIPFSLLAGENKTTFR